MSKIKRKTLYAGVVLGPFVLICLSLLIGRYPIPLAKIPVILWNRLMFGPGSERDVMTTILWDIRLPRALLGAMVGASLAASGAAFQGLFRNPLIKIGRASCRERV